MVDVFIDEEAVSAWNAKCGVQLTCVEAAKGHGRDTDVVVVELKVEVFFLQFLSGARVNQTDLISYQTLPVLLALPMGFEILRQI